MTGAAPKRVLIAGAAGFIGSHLARHIAAAGHGVLALVRPGSSLDRLAGLDGRLSVIHADLGNLAAVATQIADMRPEICLDAAWGELHGRAGDIGHLASLRNALSLAELMAVLGCRRYLHTGTCFEYALTDRLISESSPAGPHTLYGACKQAASVTIQELGRGGALSVAWPRIFYVYGPDEAPHRLVPEVIGRLLRGEPAQTTAGDQVRDYMHVEDVASAIWTVATSGHEGPVNIATGHHAPVRRVVELIGELMGRPDLLEIGAKSYRPEEPPAIRADVSLLRNLGWRPRYTLESGLRQTVEWWRHRLQEPA